MINKINSNPPIHGDNAYAFCILTRNGNQNIQPFLFNEFSNLFFSEDPTSFYFSKNKWMYLEDNAMTYYYFVNPKGILDYNLFIELLIEMINIGYYTTTLNNKFYIPGCKEYKLENKESDFIIYGYDSNVKLFFILERNLKYGYLEKREVSSTILWQSIYNTSRNNIDIHFFKANEDFNPLFDLSKCKQSLSHYINSTNDNKGYYNNDSNFGLQALQSFYNYILKIGEEKYKLNPNYFLFFYEFNLLMYKRLLYLYNNNILDKNILDSFNIIVNKSKSIRIESHKYNDNLKINNINNILDLLHTIIELEKEVLCPLVLS